MKRLLILLLVLLALPAAAQDTTPTPTPVPESTVEPEATPEATPFRARATVDVESAFVRVLPSQEAEAVASVFEHDVLEVIGRNTDGLWLEVRRPGRMFNLGWILAELLDYDFASENLPITDFDTDLLGDTPVTDTGIAVNLTAEANLREQPVDGQAVIITIPLGATVPVIARDDTAAWVMVNYRGLVGWVSSATFHRPPNILEAPIYIPPGVNTINAEIIPPEIQLGQLERFREFAQASKDVSARLVPFWENVQSGQVMPCEPPDFVQEYLISRGDVRELPELRRYVPRFNEGIDLLNQSIEPLYTCGVLQPDVVVEARNDAVNANLIFAATLDQLDSLEAIIREQNNLP